MKKFSILIVLICICIGFSGCALFVPVWECLTEPYPSTTYYYYGGCYHTTPHRHIHYHGHHGHGHKHTAHPHRPHKPSGHVGGHKPSGGGKPTGRPSGSGSRTGGSRTSSGSRR